MELEGSCGTKTEDNRSSSLHESPLRSPKSAGAPMSSQGSTRNQKHSLDRRTKPFRSPNGCVDEEKSSIGRFGSALLAGGLSLASGVIAYQVLSTFGAG